MRKYIAVKFKPEDSRTYTYHYDGDAEFAEGDMAKVEDNRSGGWKRVYVASVSDQEPPFSTKPILEKIEAEADALADRDDADLERWIGDR